MARKKSDPTQQLSDDCGPGPGRPTKYHAEIPDQARKLCALGATDAQLADFFGVCEDTVNEWKHVHPEFSESIKEGKKCPDDEVEEALFKRAKGVGNHPPETAACIFWLKNRRPDRWRDKQEVEHKGIESITVNVTGKKVK